MKTNRKILVGLMALLPLFSVVVGVSQAHAQQYSSNSAAARIDGFNVDEVLNLTAGTDLNFSVYGSPGGTVSLRIGGAQRNLDLREVDTGLYEGTYTISSRDSISSNSSVTANLRLGNQVVSKVLSESLQAGVGYRSSDQANSITPKISSFNVQPVSSLTRDANLAFLLYGTPGGKADLAINGVKGKFFLQETKSGEYTGVYTIKQRDRITANSTVTANLRVGDRVTQATLGKTLVSAGAPMYSAAQYCVSCGTVEAINIVEVKGDGSYLGTIGGGVVGALLGSQVGGGNGKTAATIAGALGGVFAGRAIEANVKKAQHHEVLVRLQNGGTQTVSFEADPGYRVGEKVRITDGVIARDL